MGAFSKALQWQRAFSQLHAMSDLALQSDILSFNGVISACADKEQRRGYGQSILPWMRALHLLDDILERGLKPTVVTFNAAATSCVAATEWQQALGLLGAIRRSTLQPSQATFHTLLDASNLGGLWELGLEFLRQREQLPSARNRGASRARELAYAAVISACSRAQQ